MVRSLRFDARSDRRNDADRVVMSPTLVPVDTSKAPPSGYQLRGYQLSERGASSS